jgi:NAD(P)H-dependent FMN reductase
MITIFSGTNRTESNTEKIANFYAQLARKQEVDTQVYALTELPDDFLDASRYGTPPKSFEQTLHHFIEDVDRFVFVVPEYNGSFPGILKVFLDTIHPDSWKGKKAALVGVATGRAGNLRGMDQLTGILNYLKMEVYSLKPPLSAIHRNMNPSGEIVNEEYIALLNSQIREFSRF